MRRSAVLEWRPPSNTFLCRRAPRMLLRNKVAVITGSGRGIGRGIARRFAQEGARVVVIDRDADVVARTATEIRQAGGTCLEVTADVSVESEVTRLFDATLREFGAL